MKSITKGYVSTLKPSKSKQQTYDDNLSVVILPSGRITFYAYSSQGGRRRYNRLMSLPDNKIDDRQLQILNQSYREQWANIHYRIGHRPQDIQEAQNQKARDQWAEIKKRPLRYVVDLYLKAQATAVASNTKAQVTLDEDTRILNREFEALMSRGMEDIDPGEIADLLRTIPTIPMRNQVRARFKALVNWAYDEQILQSKHLIERLPKKRKEVPRERLITDAEIRKLWPELHTIHKVLLATGQRQADWVKADWSMIDPITREFINPYTKSGKPNSIILPPEVYKLLPAPVEGSPAVFNSVKGIRYSSRRVGRLFQDAAERAGVDNVTGHDLRGCAFTNMADLGDVFVMERIAAHALPGVQRSYNFKSYSKEKAEMLQKWWVRLGEILYPEDGGWILDD